MAQDPVLVVHGGAWAIPDEMVEAHLNGVRAAIAAGWRVLERGGTSVEAVEAAVAVMEDDDTFDAGRGSFLNRDGKVQLDAALMEGSPLRAGGVGCVEHIRNPLRLARRLLEDSPHVYMVAEGAERFARERGIELCDNSELVIPREVERLRLAKEQKYEKTPSEFSGVQSHDTVGAVALDSSGNIAAATSTGGTLNKAPGRVGDSSLIGCGCYADNKLAAVSTTGWGEAIMKLVLAKGAADRVGAGVTPEAAAWTAMDQLRDRLGGHGGIILLDAQGRWGMAHNTPRMAWARRDRREGIAVGIGCSRT